MIVKLIGAPEDKKIVPMLANVPDTIVEFFDDEISFNNSFPNTTSKVVKNINLVFLLVKKLPVASLGSIVLEEKNTSRIINVMRDKDIPIFDISSLEMSSEEKADVIRKRISTPLSSLSTSEWPGWAI